MTRKEARAIIERMIRQRQAIILRRPLIYVDRNISKMVKDPVAARRMKAAARAAKEIEAIVLLLPSHRDQRRWAKGG